MKIPQEGSAVAFKTLLEADRLVFTFQLIFVTLGMLPTFEEFLRIKFGHITKFIQDKLLLNLLLFKEGMDKGVRVYQTICFLFSKLLLEFFLF